MEFTVGLTHTPIPDAERERLLIDPGFGRLHTDHMITVRWSAGQGWYDAVVGPYGPLSFDPATSFLHYGQTIFEGFKAYRHPDGSVAMFRPEANASRFALSAARMTLPALPAEVFLQAADWLVATDVAWVPGAPDTSLYLRPFLLGTEVGLGVRPSSEALFVLTAHPAGSYFTSGVRPVRIWLSTDYVRAAPGGTGEAKCGGNYAASLAAQEQAIAQGCDQVVFLDAETRTCVEELGGMNLFFVQADGSLVTPALTGTILRGITRESLITLCADLDIQVIERLVPADEWRAGVQSGQITEVFACGTAAVISPIGTLVTAEAEFSTGPGVGPVTARLRQALTDVQYGHAPDPHRWLRRVPAPALSAR